MIGTSEALAFFAAMIVAVYLWLRHVNTYWQRKKVPFIDPVIFFGNLKELICYADNAAHHLQKLYNNELISSEPLAGIYILQKPGLLIREPELIKAILVKDFNKFSDRFSSSDPSTDSLGANTLFLVKNPRWRQIRTKLTPVFTSGKLKQMFPLIEEIGCELDEYLCSLPVDAETKATVVEIKEINALFNTDVIATIAFGIKANSMKNPMGEFRTNGKKVFNFTWWRAFEFNVTFYAPRLVKFFGCKRFSKESTEFIRNTINYVMEDRMQSGQFRNDLIDVLIAFRKAASTDAAKDDIVLEGDALLAQAAIFFTAGFETTSSTMSFALYEMSKKPHIQDRLRNEIREALVKCDGKISYEKIGDLEYLNMVIQEILRLYPPLPFLDRVCTLAENEKGYSLQPYSDFEVPHGMPVYIPIYAIHRDEKFWINPNEFDPERFGGEKKGQQTPFTYLPFGSGPHNCIGERLALIQSKIGLINILKNHYVLPCDKSHPEMVLNPRAVMLQAKDGIYVKLVRDPLLQSSR